MTTIKHIEGRPYNGIDVSHWNGPPSVAHIRKHVNDGWLQFMGIKATHQGNCKCPDGVDPMFVANRAAAYDAAVPYVGLYSYLSAAHDLTAQALLLAETVGSLKPNEFVFLDWEEHDILTLDDKLIWHMDKLFGDRWAVYVNDSTPGMEEWMIRNFEDDLVPVIHPNWSENGWEAADRWSAVIWQVGIAPVEGWANPIDVDFITDWDALRRLVQR